MENNLQRGEVRGNHAALCPPCIPSVPTATVSLPTPGVGWGRQAEEGLQDRVESSVRRSQVETMLFSKKKSIKKSTIQKYFDLTDCGAKPGIKSKRKSDPQVSS